jgi:3-dehydroquinate dehydratase-2
MSRILILNGPNLNLLGTREPEIYGTQTLNDIETMCEAKARELGFRIHFRQSNHEGELIDWIQAARKEFKAIIINAAAYSHTSIAIYDALKAVDLPVAEVHLSNPKKREKFRRFSYIEQMADIYVAGKGPEGYLIALEKLSESLKA